MNTRPSRRQLQLREEQGTHRIDTVNRSKQKPGPPVPKEGFIYLNGNLLNDDGYVAQRHSPRNELNNFGPVTLGKGEVFIVGDNRAISYDSRLAECGPVTTSMVVGKALYILRSKNSTRNGQAIQ